MGSSCTQFRKGSVIETLPVKIEPQKVKKSSKTPDLGMSISYLKNEKYKLEPIDEKEPEGEESMSVEQKALTRLTVDIN